MVVTPPAPKQGIATSHVAGGGFGGIVGAVLTLLLAHFKVTLSTTDAAIIGATAVTAGVGLGHVIAQVGISGAVKQLWHGRP